jgi:hypothetical protein
VTPETPQNDPEMLFHALTLHDDIQQTARHVDYPLNLFPIQKSGDP